MDNLEPIGIRQLKLISGEEIMCEVLIENEEEEIMVVRNVVNILYSYGENLGFQSWIFRPYMLFQIDDDNFCELTYSNITGRSYPCELLIKQYYNSLMILKKHSMKVNEEFSTELENVFPDLDSSDLDLIKMMSNMDSDSEPNNKNKIIKMKHKNNS